MHVHPIEWLCILEVHIKWCFLGGNQTIQWESNRSDNKWYRWESLLKQSIRYFLLLICMCFQYKIARFYYHIYDVMLSGLPVCAYLHALHWANTQNKIVTNNMPTISCDESKSFNHWSDKSLRWLLTDFPCQWMELSQHTQTAHTLQSWWNLP